MSNPETRAPAPDDADPIVRLRKIVHRLRAPGGCPWDREQTHRSLLSNMLEEAYEAVDAIRSDDTPHMEEELGDLLLQVVMHAEIAAETDRFDLDSVAAVVADKLVRRHPHVFGNSDATDSDSVLQQWDAIKQQEKGGNSEKPEPYLDGVGNGLPALMKATKIQKKAARVGFDWPSNAEVFAKIDEELEEVREAEQGRDRAHFEEEIGDLLFAVTNLARREGMDAESLLAAANEKFRRRFHEVERRLREEGIPLEKAGLEKMDAHWDAIKNGPQRVTGSVLP